MSITDGRPANQTTFNNAFASKQAENTLTGKQNLANVDAASGSTVTNAQREVNSLNSFTGRAAGSAYNATPNWSDNSVGTSGDDLKDRADALTTFAAALDADKADGAASSTDNALARFDGTTGKVIKNSGVIVDDNIDVSGIRDLTTTRDMTVGQNLTVTGDLTVNGTTTTINTATLEVEDKNIIVNNGGDDASSEGAGLTVERTGTSGSIIYADAATSKFKVGAAGSEAEIATISGAQELTNKKYNGGTATAGNALRLIAPKATTAVLNTIVGTEGHIFYSTDEAKYYGDNGTNLVDLGGGSGGVGGINYVSNTNAEGGVTGWATYNDQQTFTVTIASPAVFTVGDTSLFYVGMPISFTTTGALPTGLTVSTTYYISAIPSGTTYTVSSTLGGSDVNTSGTQSGTHTDHPGVPLNGIGGTPDVTWTQGSSVVLRGNYDFRFAKGAANYMGQGVYADLDIDISDAGAVLNAMMSYAIASGTYTDGDLEAWIVDTTNGTRIQLAPYKILNHALNGDWFKGEFQTVSSSVAYRLCIHVAKPSTSAYTLKFDQITSGPQAQGKVYGSPITDWVSYTPTGSWVSNTTYTGYWRRIGDSLEAQVKVATSGAPTSATLTVNLPSGLTIDTAKLTNSATLLNTLGQGAASDSGSTYILSTSYNSTTSVVAVYQNSTGGSETVVTQAAPFTFGASDYVVLSFKVPILGWSSSVVMSNDADTRVVAAYKHTDTPTGTLANSYNVVKFTAMTQDTHAMYSASTGLWTIGVSGYYEIYSELELARTNFAAGDPHLCAVYVNGVAVAYGSVMSQGTVTRAFPKVNAIIKVNAGDTVGIYSYTNATGVTFSPSYGASSVSLRKISGPAQIAASESISARYTSTAANNLVTDTIVDFATKDWDSHGAVTTGASWKFTAPISGEYQINVNYFLSAATAAAIGNFVGMYTSKNAGAGLNFLAGDYVRTTSSVTKTFRGSVKIKLLASETISLLGYNDTGQTHAAQTTAGMNYIEINRVGNY